MIKRILLLSALLVFPGLSGFPASTYTSCFDCQSVTDVYKFKMKLAIPRIYDNTCSLGYRKYQWQLIEGEMLITYQNDDDANLGQPKIEIKNLVNKTHKMNGRNITYTCIVNNGGEYGEGPYTRVNVIGNNKTGVFKQASVCFYLDAEPSYNIGEDDEDNSLLITLSGYGNVPYIKWFPYYGVAGYSKYYQKIQVISALKGYVGGTLGCGCRAYGHKSPTRIMGLYGPSGAVSDVAAVFGQWRAAYKGRK